MIIIDKIFRTTKKHVFDENRFKYYRTDISRLADDLEEKT